MPELFLIDGDNNLTPLSQSEYDSESLRQQLLAGHPGLLGGDQMGSGAPRQWLFVAREAPVPDKEGTAGRWSLGHLFLDQDAIPTHRRGEAGVRQPHPARGRGPDARLRGQRAAVLAHLLLDRSRVLDLLHQPVDCGARCHARPVVAPRLVSPLCPLNRPENPLFRDVGGVDTLVVLRKVDQQTSLKRGFRNYIHPYQQQASNFAPDEHTARICLQVLKAAIAQLSE